MNASRKKLIPSKTVSAAGLSSRSEERPARTVARKAAGSEKRIVSRMTRPMALPISARPQGMRLGISYGGAGGGARDFSTGLVFGQKGGLGLGVGVMGLLLVE